MAEILKRIIFLSYLTGYNVATIYRCLENSDSLDYNELAELAFGKKHLKDKKVAIQKALDSTDTAIEKLIAQKISAITFLDKNYPTALHFIPDRPPVIYVKGKLRPKIDLAAVVGSRSISSQARRITGNIIDCLKSYDFGVVSGLAHGIDTIAHEHTLALQGHTVAILPVSLDRVYPAENRYLADSILDRGGVLMSELIFGINRGKASFVQRNRLQTGISKLVIPVEMGIASGTMHTITFALKQQKELLLLKRKDGGPEYEGIQYLIDKYENSGNERVHTMKGLGDFMKYLAAFTGKTGEPVQLRLF